MSTNPGQNACWIDSARGGGRVIAFAEARPEIAEDVFLAPGSTVIGNTSIAAGASVWFGSVLRGDIAPIIIGERTNIQDNSVVHVADDMPCVVGDRVVVGHRVILHGCRVGDESLIGMGATLMNGAQIGEGSIVAAGALVTEGKSFPPRSLIIGSPARRLRELSAEDLASNLHFAEKYARMAQTYLKTLAGS